MSEQNATTPDGATAAQQLAALEAFRSDLRRLAPLRALVRRLALRLQRARPPDMTADSINAMFAAVESARRIQITPEITAKAAELQQEADALGLTVEQYVVRFPERAKIDRTTRPDALPPTPEAWHPASPAPEEDSGESQ